MFSNHFKKIFIMVAIITIASIVYTTASSLLLSQSSYTSFAQTQTYNTQQQQKSKNNDTNTDNEKFQVDIEQIIGHIKMAEFNKNINNNTLAYNHTSHPIGEVLSLVTIPISNIDKKLNDTYFKDLYALSALVNPSSSSSSIPSSTSTTKEAFSKQAQSSIDLSNAVIKTVIPAKTLNTTNHNVTVIQNLLNTSKGEYEEGVKDGKIISMLEYQDGTAFMDRAYFLFNNTKSIAANGDRQMISKLFANLTQSTQQQKNQDEINKIIDEINKKLAEGSTSSPSTTTNQTTTNLSSPAIPATNTNATNTSNVNSSSLSYISKIRSLLDQVVSTYTANDTVKAKELATTAYLDNFENIEKSIGKELSDAGEQLLRVQLRDQIISNAPLSQIKQTINEANTVLDKAENILK